MFRFCSVMAYLAELFLSALCAAFCNLFMYYYYYYYKSENESEEEENGLLGRICKKVKIAIYVIK